MGLGGTGVDFDRNCPMIKTLADRHGGQRCNDVPEPVGHIEATHHAVLLKEFLRLDRITVKVITEKVAQAHRL